MPFTLAHPAAVVPLRRYLPFSALVVGSLSPDFEYPLRLAAVSRFSHTLPGVLYFCVPVGLLVLWLFHRLIKHPAMQLLPRFVPNRIEPQAWHFAFQPLDRLLLITIALTVGALTHVAWDSFTHEYGWVVERWPALQASVLTLAGHGLKLYKLLQYSSSVLGLLLLAYFFFNWLHDQPVSEAGRVTRLPEQMRRRIVAAIVLSTIAAGLGLGMWSAAHSAGLHALQVFVVQGVIGGMIGFAACMLLFSLAWRVAQPRITMR